MRNHPPSAMTDEQICDDVRDLVNCMPTQEVEAKNRIHRLMSEPRLRLRERKSK